MTNQIDIAVKFLTHERDAGRQFKSYKELPEELRRMIAESNYALDLKPIHEYREQLRGLIPAKLQAALRLIDNPDLIVLRIPFEKFCKFKK